MTKKYKKINPNNIVKTKEGNLILDSDKLSYHYDRVQMWENGLKIPPVSVDMAHAAMKEDYDRTQFIKFNFGTRF